MSLLSVVSMNPLSISYNSGGGNFTASGSLNYNISITGDDTSVTGYVLIRDRTQTTGINNNYWARFIAGFINGTSKLHSSSVIGENWSYSYNISKSAMFTYLNNSNQVFYVDWYSTDSTLGFDPTINTTACGNRFGSSILLPNATIEAAHDDVRDPSASSTDLIQVQYNFSGLVGTTTVSVDYNECSIGISWTTATNATQYKVYRSTNGTSYSLIATVSTTDYDDTNINLGTTYWYKVRPINGVWFEDAYTNLSAAVSTSLVLTPPTITNAVFNQLTNDIDITYVDNIPCTYATFKIEKKINSDSFNQIIENPSGTTTYSDTDIVNNTTYTYRIRLFVNGINSLYSNEYQVVVAENPPAQPVLSLNSNPCTPDVDLSWTSVIPTGTSDAGYRIFKSLNGVDYNEIDSGDTTFNSTTDSSIVIDTQYYYYVQAFSFGGTTNSSIKNLVSSLLAPTLSGTSDLSGITLTWASNNVCDTGYILERRDSPSGVWSEIAGDPIPLTGTSFYDDTGDLNQPYDYRVRSTDGNTFSFYSNIVTLAINTTPPIAPTLITISGITNSSTQLTWINNQPINQPESVFEYRIFRQKISSGDYVEVGDISSGNTSIIINETVDDDYRYYVAAYTDIGAASQSNILILPLYPNGLSVNRTAEGALNLVLNNSSTYVTEIEIFRSTDSGSTYSFLKTEVSGTTNTTDTSLTEDTRYDYKFHYKNGTGVTSSFSSSSTGLTYLDTPIIVTVLATAPKTLTLNWNDNSSAETGYEIYRRVKDVGSYVLIHTTTVNINTYTDTGLEDDTIYQYYVRAIKQ